MRKLTLVQKGAPGETACYSPDQMAIWARNNFAGSGFFDEIADLDAIFDLFSIGQVLAMYRWNEGSVTRRMVKIALEVYPLFLDEDGATIREHVTQLLAADAEPNVIHRTARFCTPRLKEVLVHFDETLQEHRRARDLAPADGLYQDYLRLVLLTILTTP